MPDILKLETPLYLKNPITVVKVVLKCFKFIYFPPKILYSLCKCSVVSSSFLRNIFCDVRLIPSKTRYGRPPVRTFSEPVIF